MRYFKIVLSKLFLDFLIGLIGVSIITFLFIHLIPGDPVLMLSGEKGLSLERYTAIKKELGLDQTLMQQYLLYMKNVIHGDLGRSYLTQKFILQDFFEHFSATLELGCMALLWPMIIGIPLGIFAALKKNRWPSTALLGLSLFGYSLPIFWWGLVLILFFSIFLQVTPVAGRIDMIYDIPNHTGFYLFDTLFLKDGGAAFKNAVWHLILPALTLGTIPLAIIFRVTKSHFQEIYFHRPYIKTAWAMKLPQHKIIWRYTFKNILIPLLATIGVLAVSLISGAILTETIFSWPGIGKWMVSNIMSRDYPAIQGGILLISFFVILINQFINFLSFILDPVRRNKHAP